MLKKLLCVCLAIVLVLSISGASSAVEPEQVVEESIQEIVREEKVFTTATIEDDFVDNHIIVLLTNEESLKFKEYSIEDFPEIQLNAVIDPFEETERIAKAKQSGDVSVLGNIGKSTFEEITDSIELSTYHKVICLELKEPGKENVLNGIKKIQNRDDIYCAEPDFIMNLCDVVPNDPYIGSQWGIYDINMPAAWSLTIGLSTVRVGVIDSGIQADHPDFLGKIDSVMSRDLIYSMEGNYLGDSLEDTNGHGTMVAGIIAARGNNNIGICGVAYNIQVVSLRAHTDAYESTLNVVAAINYADNAKIPILNYSGGTTVYATALRDAIANYDGLFVCSAGNNNMNIDNNGYYPASLDLPNIITVGAITQAGGKHTMSNYGSVNVDIFAPGDAILSCTNDGGYGNIGMTSAAAPHVAGVAALIKSQNPDMTAAEIKARILNGAQPVAALSGLCVTGGKLNAFQALHTHSYGTVQQYNSTHHAQYCSCGDIKLSLHVFRTVGTTRVCRLCSYNPNNRSNSN